jgi:heat shock protein HslJ
MNMTQQSIKPGPFLTSLLLLAACSSTHSVDMSDLTDKTWKLIAINGQPINVTSQQQVPHFQIKSDLSLAGFAGCNRFFGNIKVTGTALEIENMGMTKMLCPPPQQNLEDALIDVLNSASEVQISGRGLTLKQANEELLFQLQ